MLAFLRHRSAQARISLIGTTRIGPSLSARITAAGVVTTLGGRPFAPVILQGHNFPGHPLAGVLMMIGFTTAASFPLAWSREATGTIVGPSVLHGVLNAVAALPLIFVAGANPLISSPAGLLGTAVLVLISCALAVSRRARRLAPRADLDEARPGRSHGRAKSGATLAGSGGGELIWNSPPHSR